MGNRSLFCDGLTLLIERVFDKVNTRLDHFVRAFECGFQFSAGQDGERPGCVVEINRVCGVHFWRSELVSNLYRRSCGFLGGEVGFPVRQTAFVAGIIAVWVIYYCRTVISKPDFSFAICPIWIMRTHTIDSIRRRWPYVAEIKIKHALVKM